MIKNIAVTGYYWSGSSAVLDLLSEYDCVTSVPINRDGADYEHVLFYYGGGLFDLCNHLSHGNTVVGSDYAINTFLDSMKRLYVNRFGWFGTYKRLVGENFMKVTNDFISEIAVSFEGSNLNHAAGTVFSLKETIKRTIWCVLNRKFINPCAMKRVDDKKKVYMALPSDEELVHACQKYTRRYMELFNVNEGGEYRLFDHLIWPQQIDEFGKYLDPNLKIIVVKRDARDIYISNKYLSKVHFFPIDINEFIDLYRRIVTKISDNPNVIIVNFEDLVYNYNMMESFFEKQLCLSHDAHNQKNKYFNPVRSIENTQVHRCKKEWIEETSIFTHIIPYLCYQFPFERIPDINKVMDKTA